MLNIATAAISSVYLASYANAVRWNWQDLQDASVQGVTEAENLLKDAATASAAADKRLRAGQTEPDSDAT